MAEPSTFASLYSRHIASITDRPGNVIVTRRSAKKTSTADRHRLTSPSIHDRPPVLHPGGARLALPVSQLSITRRALVRDVTAPAGARPVFPGPGDGRVEIQRAPQTDRRTDLSMHGDNNKTQTTRTSS